MQLARIAELLAPFLTNAGSRQLTTSDLEHISTYIDILLRWNARINLTSIRDPEAIVTRHFGESFFTAGHLFPVRSAVPPVSSVGKVFHVADVGSGAGFPGVPIKLWQPHLSLTLIEANHKKAAFLREIVRALTLTDVNVQTGRAESLDPAAFEIVTLRAVERFEFILPVAARLVAPGGRLALLISSSQVASAESVLVPGFHPRWPPPLPVPLSRSRVLALASRLSDPSQAIP